MPPENPSTAKKSFSGTVLELFTHAGVVVILLVSLFLVFFRLYLPYYTSKDREVEVPDLRHVPFERAAKILAARGLRCEVMDSVWSPAYEPYAVVQQYPRALATVKTKRVIQLWLNARIPTPVVFPDLRYTSPAFAREQLERLELKPGMTLYKPDLANNAVIEFRHRGTVLQPGEKIGKGEVVDIVVGTAIFAEPQ